MTIPVLTPALTRAVAKVLKSRARASIAAGQVFAGVSATVNVTPAPPLIGLFGPPGGHYAISADAANNLVAGSYVARAEVPGVGNQAWSGPVVATGTGPFVANFSSVPVPVGNSAVIAVSPAGLAGEVTWRSTPFDVLTAISLAVAQGNDPLDITLLMAKSDAATTQATVDWGDGTAPVTDTIANWIIGKSHSYASPGTYTIQATAKDVGNGSRGVVTQSVTLVGVYLASNTDGVVLRKIHLAITPSARAAFASGTVAWGDGKFTATGPSSGSLTDIPHTYPMGGSGTFLVTFSSNTGLVASIYAPVN
jgi:hypothetical protein